MWGRSNLIKPRVKKGHLYMKFKKKLRKTQHSNTHSHTLKWIRSLSRRRARPAVSRRSGSGWAPSSHRPRWRSGWIYRPRRAGRLDERHARYGPRHCRARCPAIWPPHGWTSCGRWWTLLACPPRTLSLPNQYGWNSKCSLFFFHNDGFLSFQLFIRRDFT